MSVTIDDQFLEWANMSEQALQNEIAAMLYDKRKLTCAQARRLTDMERIEFYQFLGRRQISIMDEDDIMREIEAINAQYPLSKS